MNINLLRPGDKITLKNQAVYELQSFEPKGGTYEVLITDQILNYNLDGTCLQHSSLNIESYELVARDDDNVPYYIPRIEVESMPILEVNGENMIIPTILNLDGLEIKEPQTLKASFKPTVVAHLIKKLGREINVIKTEYSVCESEKEAEDKVNEIKSRYIVKEENEQNN